MAKARCSRCGNEHPPISPQRRRFAELYAVYFDAQRSAVEAGYSERSGKYTGYKLLHRVDVRCELKHLLSQVSEKLELRSEDVINGLLRIAQFDPADIFHDNGGLKDLSDIPKHIRQAIAGMKFKDGHLEEIRLPEKVRAYELLGKHKRLFTDVIRHEGDLDITARIARGRKRAMGRKDEGD